jgi:transcriptional regulator with XRE-family HTH domain
VATKKKPTPKKRGRPSKFDEGYSASFPDLARKLAMLGAKDSEIAEVFGVSESTLNLWKTKHQDLSESLKAGKLIADAEVADRLFQRALGYEHEDVDIRVVDKEIVQTPIRKYYPPDTTAAIFWLKNRQKQQWRDKVETGITDSEGKDVPLDPVEGARRIAFLLHKAAQPTGAA